MVAKVSLVAIEFSEIVFMKDIQNQLDHRRINIKKVGVKTISYPITLQDKAQVNQHTIATLNMYVNLPHQFKGTHMSRFVEILNDFHGKIDLKNFQLILEKMKDKLDAEAAHIKMKFPFFIQRKQTNGDLDTRCYHCVMHGSLERSTGLKLEISIPLQCKYSSKSQINKKTAGIDQGYVKIAVKFNHFIWIEDLIMLVEQSIDDNITVNDTSCDIASLEIINSQLSERLEKESAIKWHSIITEKRTNSYTTFATTEF